MRNSGDLMSPTTTGSSRSQYTKTLVITAVMSTGFSPLHTSGMLVPISMNCLEAENHHQEQHSDPVDHGAASRIGHICNCDVLGRRRIPELNQLFVIVRPRHRVGPIHFAHYSQYRFVDYGPQHALVTEQ